MSTPTLTGRHILMVVAPVDFRDEELLEPRARFEAEGAIVEIASTSTDVARGILGAEVTPDVALSAVDPHRYAAIVVVGGSGARTYLWDDHRLHAVLRVARRDGATIGAICLAPVALAKAGILDGVHVTAFGDARAKLELDRGGAVRADHEHVVTDRGIVTAAGPRDAGRFAEALIRQMRERSAQGTPGSGGGTGVAT